MAKLKVGKGSKLSLTKEAPGLRKVEVQLFWDSPDVRPAYDLDASALQLAASADPRYAFGHSLGDSTVCFYGQPVTPGIESSGDDREGGVDDAGEANETLIIDFDKVNPACEIIPVLLSIHDAGKRVHTFDRVTNGRVDLVDEKGEVLVTADLSGLAGGSTSAMFVVFTKKDGQWSFENVSQGYNKDLLQMLSVFGVDAEY